MPSSTSSSATKTSRSSSSEGNEPCLLCLLHCPRIDLTFGCKKIYCEEEYCLTLVKQFGNYNAKVQFSKEKNNLFNVHSFKYYDCPRPPTGTSTSAVPPPSGTDADIKKWKAADAKAMNILAQTMSDDIFQKVADCNTAKEIWEKLSEIVSGSADERKDRRSYLITQYENFKKAESESVADMYNRLSLIISELRSLEKDISLTEINDKILTCFPSSWDSRIWSIKDGRNVCELSTEALLGKLKSYEQFIKKREEEQKTSTPTEKAEKTIAFKAQEEEPKEKVLEMKSL
ncbi:60S ribosomal protein L28-1 [Platanthera zijinensis]|uniref:60S ribosomal protein L28-1 n=1 Tax=Platanthera zijinensis TaxID=2320716 RepID=A0AAP0B265_9ASPA